LHYKLITMQKIISSVVLQVMVLIIAIFSAKAQTPIYDFPFNNALSATIGTGAFSSTGTSFTSDRNSNLSSALFINNTNGITSILSGLPTGNSARTVSLMFQRSGSGDGIFSYGSAGVLQMFGVYLSAGGNLVFQGFGSGNDLEVPIQGGVTQNEWHHLVVTYAAGTVSVYYDGVEKASASRNLNTGNSAFKLGNMVGHYDDLKIYDVALTAQQIQLLNPVPPTVWVLRNAPDNGKIYTTFDYFKRPRANTDSMGVFLMGFTPHTSSGGLNPTVVPSTTHAFVKTEAGNYNWVSTTQFQAYACDYILDTLTNFNNDPGLVKDTTYIAGSAFGSNSYPHASIRRRVGYMNEIGTAQWANVRTISDKGYRGIAANKKYGNSRIVAVGFASTSFLTRAFISSSKDNGVTWTDYTHPDLGGGILYHVKWAGPSTIYAVGSTYVGTDATTIRPLLMKSTDTANTWHDIAINITGITTLGSVYAHDSLTLWITCNGGRIIHSNDGGGTWVEQTTGITSNLNQIWFANNQNGWAVGDSGMVIKTINGGQTWKRETFPNNVSKLNDVKFLNDTNGVLLASNGAIYQYNPCNTTYSTVSITSCGSYVLNGNTYDTAGTYTATILNSKGCDSVMTFTLTIIQPVRDTVSITACGSFTWANVGTYTSSTTVTHAFAKAAANGCDSIVTLNLTIKSASAATINGTLNQNGFYVFNGDTLIVGGLYTKTLVNTAGCDSVVTLNLRGGGLITVYNFNNTLSDISGYTPFTGTGTSFTADKKGNANSAVSVNNANGITASIGSGLPTGGSTRTVSLWFKRTGTGDGIFGYGTAGALQMFGAYIAFGGIAFQAYGDDIDVPVSGGVTLNEWHHLAITFEGGTVRVYYDGVQRGTGSRNLNTGNSAFRLGNMQGDFDNLYIYNTALTAAQISAIYNADRCIKTTIKDTTVCGSFVWNNVTYTQSALITVDTTQTANDCDSIFRINLTVKQPTSSTHNAVICAGSSYTFNSITFTTDTVYTTILTNAAGCDSTVTLNLSIKQPVSNTVSLSACNSFTWTNATNDTYTRDTTVTYTFNNGCDSTVTLNLTINHPVTNNVNLSGCNEVGIVGFPLFTRDTTFIHTIANGAANGCDSIVTVNIVIIPVSKNVTQSGNTLTAQQSGARYQWFNCDTEQEIEGDTLQSFTPAVSGRYLVRIKTGDCNVNSECYLVTITGINAIDDQNAISNFYPNPAYAIINIEVKANTEVYIYNLLGKQVFSQNIEAGKNVLHVSHLAEGVYVLKTKEGATIKFIKQ
jgi:hypothetical protein